MARMEIVRLHLNINRLAMGMGVAADITAPDVSTHDVPSDATAAGRPHSAADGRPHGAAEIDGNGN